MMLIPSCDIGAVVQGSHVDDIRFDSLLLIRNGHEYLFGLLIVGFIIHIDIFLIEKVIGEAGEPMLEFLVELIAIAHSYMKSIEIIIFIIESSFLLSQLGKQQIAYPLQQPSSLCFQLLQNSIIIIMENAKQFNKEVLMKNILSQKWQSQSHTVFYVCLFKQSDTGILFNERMLVIEDKTFMLFYTKYYKPLHVLYQLEKKGNVPIKDKRFILNTTILQTQNIVTIKFSDEQNYPKSWIFKFHSDQLADKWVHLYNDLHERCMSKSIKSKDSKSTNLSFEYSSILSNLKYGTSAPSENKQEDSNYTQGKKRKVNVKKIQ